MEMIDISKYMENDKSYKINTNVIIEKLMIFACLFTNTQSFLFFYALHIILWTFMSTKTIRIRIPDVYVGYD